MNAAVEARRSSQEAVGPAFTQERMLQMRDKTRDMVNQIGAAVKPGMVEEDAVELAKDLLASNDMLRGWHDVVVRFGRNTVKTFGDPSEPGVVLGENDIVSVDIGPVWEDWEGDAGDTFVFGNDPRMLKCAADARQLFHIVRRQWQSTGMSGKELYDFADAETRRLGWELNLDLSGHRLSDFPHAAIFNGSMAEIDFKPSPLLWILEMHIRHPSGAFGAFFEDMLLDDSYFAV